MSSPSKLAERQVNISHAITRAAQSLTLPEKRVLFSAIASINPKEQYADGLSVEIPALEYAETFEIAPNHAYEQLRQGADTLAERWIVFHEPVKVGARATERLRWIITQRYIPGEGRLGLTLHPALRDQLWNLKRQLTSYQLKQAAALRSVYSWRLLELFAMFKDTGLLRIKLDEFHHAMDAPDSLRKTYKDLRRRIIEPAVKELTDRAGYDVQWKTTKDGQTVTGLEFRFRRSPQQTLDLEGGQGAESAVARHEAPALAVPRAASETLPDSTQPAPVEPSTPPAKKTPRKPLADDAARTRRAEIEEAMRRTYAVDGPKRDAAAEREKLRRELNRLKTAFRFR